MYVERVISAHSACVTFIRSDATNIDTLFRDLAGKPRGLNKSSYLARLMSPLEKTVICDLQKKECVVSY